MDIRLGNIHTKLNYFTPHEFGLNYVGWAEPIAVSMIKAYQTYHDIDKVENLNDYIELMLDGRLSANSKYTSIEQISSRGDVEDITAHLTATILTNFIDLEPLHQKDLKKYLQYLIAEILNNVADHSGSTNGGFAMAQYYPTKRKVQVAVADSGVGFLKHIHKAYPKITTDEEAIKKAIEMGVTASNNRMYGHERNAGYGLYALIQIIKETRGKVVIISNFGMLRCVDGEITTCTLDKSWNGTVVAFEFIEKNTDYEFEQMMSKCMFMEDEDDEDFF
ncbi:MAG: ATP-binding protein [Sulfurimonas sp.]|uniref:ATP-binding protein n=1 Tax=Sulfurimonas sp. TaxID=2022749 RepID=UPI002607C089|nr:ATP-binding protein [Sulfurimonas sp.]MCW8895456.1 ATP-binding protein [Sulfurimonas sp.]MCW8953840.1 ATP-binding protein [Sulfurimonas sp.]MCW9067389.1 ATP-binding protein [Sulfurimonas sp.]